MPDAETDTVKNSNHSIRRALGLMAALVVVTAFVFHPTSLATLLPFLQCVGGIITGVSGFWTATHETNYKDDSGIRRQLPAGHLSRGLIVAGFVVTVLTGVAQYVVKNREDFAKAEATKRQELQHKVDVAVQEKSAAEQKAIEVAIQVKANEIATAQRDLHRQNVVTRRLQEIAFKEEASAANLQAERIRQSGKNQETRTRRQIEMNADEQRRRQVTQQLREEKRNVQALRVTLNSLNRTLNPIQNVQTTYVVTLPLHAPELAGFNARFEAELGRYWKNEQVQGVDYQDPTFQLIGQNYLDDKGRSRNNIALVIRPSSDLYSIFPSSLLNYPVDIFVWRKSVLPKIIDLANPPTPPDFTMSSPASITPRLAYVVSAKRLVLFFENVSMGLGTVTGRILAVPDLMGTQVQVTRQILDAETWRPSSPSLTPLQQQCYVSRLTMFMSKQIFMFDEGRIRHYHDAHRGIGGAFTFKNDAKQFQRSKRLLTE